MITKSKWVAVGTLSAVAALAGATNAAAQTPVGPAAVVGGGYFQAGYMDLGLEELNASLDDSGYPSLDSGFITLGGAGYGSRGRFLIGGEGHGILENSETTPDGAYEISAGGGYGLFRVGYLAYSEQNFDVFPLFGIGGGGLNLDIKNRSAPLFDDVLDDPARSSSLSTGGFLLDLSVGATYRLELADEDGERGGMLFGVQVGYTFQPGETSWDLDGLNDVAGGPDFQIEGFHIRFSVGGWGEEPAEEEEGADA